MTLFNRLAAFVVVASLPLGGCRAASAPEFDLAAPIPSSAPAIDPGVSTGRGEIVEQSSLMGLDDPDQVIGDAVRAVYRSVSGVDGTPREVSGTFLVPRGDSPPGGWPVVSMAHGTTGIGAQCGPSQRDDLMGNLPAVLSYLAAGYAVAMSDYEGLGTPPGAHPYLEPRTAAFNVIDAVRALRNIFPDVSARWAAFGHSQGGQAAWAADEVAGWYGDGLDLVGTVALSPAANITPMADLAESQSLTGEQQGFLPLIIAGIQRYDAQLAEKSPLSDMTPSLRDDMVRCQPDGSALQADLLPEDFATFDDEVFTARFRTALRRVALPQQPLTAPMLVINGLDDQTIPAQWVSFAVDGSCDLGGAIEHIEVLGAGHGDLGEDAYVTAEEWVGDRFASLPAESTCGAPPRTLS